MKVVKCVTADLTSVLAAGKAGVKYKVHHKVYAPDWLLKHGYGCLVFENLAYAIACAKTYYWVCKFYHAAVNDKERMILPKPIPIEELKRGRILVTPAIKWPNGTLMFKGVTLLAKIT